MKKVCLIVANLLWASAMFAQPWLPNPDKPGKLKDIISEYEKQPHSFEAEEESELPGGKDIVKEDKDYHFSRWVWYWQQHLDEKGNLVSPVKTFKEWKAFDKVHRDRNAVSKTTNASQWTFAGPSHSPGEYNGIGRINVVAFHPTDTNTFIIGSGGGGAWRTTTGGLTWTSLYDNLPVLGVADIDYNPLNPNTIFLCTGDGEAGDTKSVGLLKSTNGGATWDTTGLQYSVTDFILIHNLLINPLDTSSMLVATTEGIKKSLDGGNTWTNVQTGFFRQVLYNPIDTAIVYACNYNAGNSNIFRSVDGGLTWASVTNLGNSQYIRLAVTVADPGIVMAVVANGQSGLNGIYRSTDTGGGFVKLYGDSNDCFTNFLTGALTPDNSTCDGQAWYDLCIAVSPLDPNVVLVGGVNTWYSADGGFSWTIANQWYGGLPGIKTVHADKHYLTYHPLQPSLLFECNDGGIYKTAAPTSTIWNDLSNGLGITQFYRNAITDNADFVLGGAQDNGTKGLNFSGQSSEEGGGDGMECQIDYSDAETFYTSYQNGNFSRTTDGGNNYTDISQNIPGNPEGDWITPLVIHPLLPTYLLAGYQHMFLSQDKGSSWADISPLESGSQNIRRIAISPADAETVYFLKSSITIRRTKNLGNTWTLISVPYPNEYISDIQADPKDADHLWVTFSGYTSNKVAEYRDGLGWSLKNQGLPNIPINCITIDSSNGTQYLGTDIAVFYKDTSMTQWELYNNDLPTISVTDLGINYATNEIWAATYGRGMWKSPKLMAEPTGIPTLPFAPDVITVSPNPSNGHFIIKTGNKALLDQATDLKIINLSGSIAWRGQGRFDGNGNLNVSASPLAKGSYVVEVSKSGHSFARAKLVIY